MPRPRAAALAPSDKAPLAKRVHAFLHRHGHINFGLAITLTKPAPAPAPPAAEAEAPPAPEAAAAEEAKEEAPAEPEPEAEKPKKSEYTDEEVVEELNDLLPTVDMTVRSAPILHPTLPAPSLRVW